MSESWSGGIVPALSAILGAAASWLVGWGRMKAKFEDLASWKHDHETDARTRDHVLNELQVLSASSKAIQESSLARLTILEEWVRGHDKWAGEKAEAMSRLQAIAEGQETRLRIIEDALRSRRL